MNTYQRITFEVQRSNFQEGADPASIGKLNECLLWTPWSTVDKVGASGVRTEEDMLQFAREKARYHVRNDHGMRAKGSTTPLPRYRIVRVVAAVEVIETMS
jgi:hypothetical protein